MALFEAHPRRVGYCQKLQVGGYFRRVVVRLQTINAIQAREHCDLNHPKRK